MLGGGGNNGGRGGSQAGSQLDGTHGECVRQAPPRPDRNCDSRNCSRFNIEMVRRRNGVAVERRPKGGRQDSRWGRGVLK